MKKVWISLAALILIIAFLFWPHQYPASPKWDVLVLDSMRHPVTGASVRLSYTNYSIEPGGKGHELTLYTDDRGRATFPAQTGRYNWLQRISYTTMEATSLAHASYGNHAGVAAFLPDGRWGDAITGKYITDWQGSPAEMYSEIVVK
jgi:hypothetical protein